MKKHFLILFVCIAAVVAVSMAKDKKNSMGLPGMDDFSSSESAVASDDSIFSADEISDIADETQDIEKEDDHEQISQEILEKILMGMDIDEYNELEIQLKEEARKKAEQEKEKQKQVIHPPVETVEEVIKEAPREDLEEIIVGPTRIAPVPIKKITRPKPVQVSPPKKAARKLQKQPVKKTVKKAPKKVVRKKIVAKPPAKARRGPVVAVADDAAGSSSFDRGVRLYASRELRKASQEFEKAVDENEEDLQAYYMLADVYYQLYDMDQAWRNVRMAVSLNGGKKSPLYRAIEREIKTSHAIPLSIFIVFTASMIMLFMGSIWFVYKRKDLGRTAIDEIRNLKKEIEIIKMKNDIQDPRVRYYKAIEACENGNTMLALNNFKTAEEEFQTAAILYPQVLSAYLGLGYIHFSQQKYEAAITDYAKAIEVDPNSATAYYGIGRSFGEKGNQTVQLEKIQTAVQLDPSFREAKDALQYLQSQHN